MRAWSTVLGLVAVGAIEAGCGAGSSAPADLAGSVSRGSVRLQIDPGTSNVSTSHIPANEVTVTFRDDVTPATALYVAGFEDRGGGSYFKRWDLTLTLDGDLAFAVGVVFHPISSATGATGTATSYFFDDSGSWTASSGTVSVTSVLGAKVSFALDAVTMDAHSGPGERAMGTFLLSGTLTINNINAVCDCIN
jgi:hypothetical protein